MAKAKTKNQQPTFGSVTHEMVIPDELLAWGMTPSVAVHHAIPWAREIDRLLGRRILDEEELTDTQTTQLMSLLEGLTAEAVAARRADLLTGFDIVTAEMLRLVFVVTRANGTVVEVGRNSQWSYDEMRALLATSDPSSAMVAATRVKALLGQVFGPNADEGGRDLPVPRVAEVYETETRACCSTCETRDASVMLGIHGRFEQCYQCWSEKVYGRTPSAEELKARDKFVKEQLARNKLAKQLDWERKNHGGQAGR